MADLISAIVTSGDREDALTVVPHFRAGQICCHFEVIAGAAVLHNDRRLPAVLGSDGVRVRSGVSALIRALPAAR